ncbi:hypothetical protein NMG60_11019642 [Bertholletia excelsa]
MGQHGDAAAGTDFRRRGSPMDKPSIFYRLIVPSIIQEKKMRIPEKFVRKLGNDLPAVATLTTPNGCVWQVGLKRIDDKVCFTDGWYEFVEHQAIRVGYLLVFTYEGNSNFSVNIYDMATAEIKYHCNPLSGPVGSKPLNLDYHMGMGAVNNVNGFQAELIRPGIPMSHGSLLDEAKGNKQHLIKNFENVMSPYIQSAGYHFGGTELKSSNYKASEGGLRVDFGRSAAQPTRDIGIQCNHSELVTSAYEIRLQSLTKKPETSRKRKRGNELDSPASHGGELASPGSDSSGSFMKRYRVLSPEEKERVLNAAKMFQSENPFCRVILRRSYVYKGIGLHMPASFAEKYLSGVSGFVTLQGPSGEKWPVRCMWRDGSAKLSKGWPEFVLANKLEEGDVCVFELVKMGDVLLKVTIFRAVGDAGPVNQFQNDMFALPAN